MIPRSDIRPGDVLLIDGWLTNTVDGLEWFEGHGNKPALRLTGWRIVNDGDMGQRDGYGSTTVVWNDDSTKIELLTRGKPSPDAFAIYERLRAEDP